MNAGGGLPARDGLLGLGGAGRVLDARERQRVHEGGVERLLAALDESRPPSERRSTNAGWSRLDGREPRPASPGPARGVCLKRPSSSGTAPDVSRCVGKISRPSSSMLTSTARTWAVASVPSSSWKRRRRLVAVVAVGDQKRTLDAGEDPLDLGGVVDPPEPAGHAVELGRRAGSPAGAGPFRAGGGRSATASPASPGTAAAGPPSGAVNVPSWGRRPSP